MDILTKCPSSSLRNAPPIPFYLTQAEIYFAMQSGRCGSAAVYGVVHAGPWFGVGETMTRDSGGGGRWSVGCTHTGLLNFMMDIYRGALLHQLYPVFRVCVADRDTLTRS